jgi:hypothetical protein
MSAPIAAPVAGPVAPMAAPLDMRDFRNQRRQTGMAARSNVGFAGRMANVATANPLAGDLLTGGYITNRANTIDANTRSNDLNAANVGQVGSMTRYNDSLSTNLIPAQARREESVARNADADADRTYRMTAPLVQQEQTRADFAEPAAEVDLMGKRQANSNAFWEENRRQQAFDAQAPSLPMQPYIPVMEAAMKGSSYEASPAAAPFMGWAQQQLPQPGQAPAPTPQYASPAPSPAPQAPQQQPAAAPPAQQKKPGMRPVKFTDGTTGYVDAKGNTFDDNGNPI